MLEPVVETKQPYCTAPWHNVSLSPSGEIGPCCIVPFGLGNVAKGETLDSAWNGPAMRKFRRELLDGKMPKGCQQCYNKDQVGVKSTRSFFVEIFEEWRNRKGPYSEEAFHDDFFHLDLSLSNKCNLKCRFCYSGNSTSWFRERDLLVKEDPSWMYALGLTDDVVDVPPEELLPFISKLTNLRQIELKGGEPFMSKGHFPMLKMLIDSGRAKDLKLQYTTNGTKIDDSVFEMLKEFRQISFAVSVDGLGSVYRYIRGGIHSFEDTVVPQLRKIAARKMPNLDLNLHFTICAYNLLELAKFLQWHEAADIDCTVSFGFVEAPPFLSSRVLPFELIEESARRLAVFDSPQARELVGGLNALRANIDPDRQRRLRRQFFNYTRRLDQLRGVSLGKEIPELADFHAAMIKEYAPQSRADEVLPLDPPFDKP